MDPAVPTGRPDAPKAAADDDDDGMASLIRALDRRCRSGDPVTLGDAMDLAGARIHGAAILLLALPESIPLPIPSVGAILGVPLLVISVNLALFGEQGDLPERARGVRLPRRMIDMMTRHLTGPLTRLERMSGERLATVARRERPVGLLCTLMSVLLLLPVPLMNVPPALVLVCLSWGLVQRDGLFVAAGMAMAVGVVITGAALAALLFTAFDGFAI